MRLTTLLALLLLAGTCAQAAQIRKGETACRHEKALLEYQQAIQTGDQRTIDWLFLGSVCLVIPEDTHVAVMKRNDDGNHQLRTVERRRNFKLWAAADSVNMED